MNKQVNGQLLWGAGDSIHELNFSGSVNMEKKIVEDLKFEMDNTFLEAILQDVFKAGSQEALRIANA